MKEEIVIPPQYEEIIKAEAERKNISVDKVVHIALKKFLRKEQGQCRMKRKA